MIQTLPREPAAGGAPSLVHALPEPVAHRADGAPVYLMHHGGVVRRMVRVSGGWVPAQDRSRSPILAVAFGVAGTVATGAWLGPGAALGAALVMAIAAGLVRR